jgi:hypothetical protein
MEGGENMKKKILMIVVACMVVAMLVTPVMAIGPTNAEGKNPNLVIVLGGMNTQIWLPSGVMNEWINNPMTPGPFRVTLKDAAKFQIKKAINIGPADLMQIYATENQWFLLSQPAFAALLSALGGDPSIADPYTEGIYLKMVFVGWSP